MTRILLIAGIAVAAAAVVVGGIVLRIVVASTHEFRADHRATVKRLRAEKRAAEIRRKTQV